MEVSFCFPSRDVYVGNPKYINIDRKPNLLGWREDPAERRSGQILFSPYAM